MKHFLFIAFALSWVSNFAQTKIYYDNEDNPVTKLAEANYYKISIKDKVSKKVNEKTFFINDSLKAISNYRIYTFLDSNDIEYEETVLEGKHQTFYENGKLKEDGSYKNGKLEGRKFLYFENGKLWENLFYKNGNFHGDIFTYWKNGKKKRHDVYLNGKLVEGQTWDSLGNETPYSKYFIMTEFPGGAKKMLKYISRNFQYPVKAKNKGISGYILASFAVEKDGSITNVKIKRSLDELLDAEAIRVIKTMPKWIPGTKDGYPIRVTFNLPINVRPPIIRNSDK